MGLRSVAQCMIVSRAVGMFLSLCDENKFRKNLETDLFIFRGTNPVFEKLSLCMRILE
jgi:hypothetical protein